MLVRQACDLRFKPVQVALPFGIFRRKLRQALRNIPAFVQGVQSAGFVATLPKARRDIPIVHQEIVLPTRVARIGFRETVGDREAVVVGLQRAHEVALRPLHVADLVG